MSLQLCILASGSSGNCAVLRAPGGEVVLIDAGIGPRTAAGRMSGTGVGISDVGAICLTHLDTDHFRITWLNTLQNRGIRVFCHENCRDELAARAADRGANLRIETFNGQTFEPIDGVKFRGLPLEHDRTGSHGFVIEGLGGRIGYATDLGRVPRMLVDEFCGVNLLALESNYDPQMELNSSRPWILKQRIMGGKGHLSNQQAFDAVRAILDGCEARSRRMPEHIVLLHRSRQCNCPRLLRKLFEADPRISPRLTLAEQYEPTPWLKLGERRPVTGEQLLLPM